MAYDYDKMKTAYESLSKDQQKQLAEQYKDNANFQQFAVEYTQKKYGTWNNNVSNTTTKKETPAVDNSTPTPETPTTPVTPTTPKVDNTVVKTEDTIKQEWALKPLDQDYYNQTSQEAQDKIISNLNNYRQTNPEYFKDYESFKKNFSYDARSEEQKNTLDQWYGGYQKGLQLSSLPVTDLYTQYKDGSISVNDLESLRISNPTKYAELQNTINKGNIIAAYDDDKGMDTWTKSIQEMAYDMLQQTFMKFMSGDSSSWASNIFREYEAKMESEEMLALSDKTTEVQEEIENIQSDLDAIKKSVEAEYAGTWASRAKINAIISDRSYDLQLQLRTLNSEYNKYATQYNNRMQQYQNEFSMQIQEYQMGMQERNQQMSELGFALDLMNFETNDQKQEREWNYRVKQQEYQNGNINSKDYDTRYKAALNSVQNLLSQYEWIPMVRSAEEMADDILKAIDNGSSLGKELSKINQQIQQKPEYKVLYNNTYGTGSSSWIGKTFKLWDTEYIEYNGGIYTADQFNKLFGGANGFIGATGNAKAYDVVDERALNPNPMSVAGYDGNTLGWFLTEAKNQKGKSWGQCGSFVNDYLQYIGMTDAAHRYYDNELSTKLNSINTEAPREWAIAVFDYNHISKSTGKNHGHVGIVTKVTDDGIRVRDSNYSTKNPEVIMDRFIAKGSDERNNNLKWYFDPSKPAIDRTGSSTNSENLPTLTSNTVTDNDIYRYNDSTLNRAMSAEERQAVLDARNAVYSNPDSSIEDILRFSQWGKTPTDTTVQSLDKYAQALTSLGQLTELLNGANTWPLIWILRSANPYDVKAREINTAIAGLLPTLARWVYGEVWVLTDKDIEHYSQTVPNLKSTSQINDAILAMSLEMLADGYKRKLATQASLGYDVSGMQGIYTQIMNKADELRKGIEGWSSNTKSSSTKEVYTPKRQQLGTYTDIYTRGGNSNSTSNVGGYSLPSNFYQS